MEFPRMPTGFPITKPTKYPPKLGFRALETKFSSFYSIRVVKIEQFVFLGEARDGLRMFKGIFQHH